MLQGRSHAEGPAGYIGAAARAANRQRQIHALEEQMEVLRVKIQGAKEELEDCQARLEQLERERTQMPTAGGVGSGAGLLEQSRQGT